MKILLMQNVPGLGVAGDVKNVAMGYARNYLIPKELAVLADPGTVKVAQAQQKAQEKREAHLSERAVELAEQMAALRLTFQAKAGPTGRLYGSITTAEIAEALGKKLGVVIDRRKILDEPLRDVGKHTVSVRLSAEVVGQVQVVIQAEGAEAPAEPIAEPAAETSAEPPAEIPAAPTE